MRVQKLDQPWKKSAIYYANKSAKSFFFLSLFLIICYYSYDSFETCSECKIFYSWKLEINMDLIIWIREILCSLIAAANYARALKIFMRWYWRPPQASWLRNADGLLKSCFGDSASLTIFRDAHGFHLKGFGHHTAYYAEILAAILAIEAAGDYGQNTLWLEITYSIYVVSSLIWQSKAGSSFGSNKSFY